ncbi:MAG: hypothetical protein HYX69_08500 [Planctomycetia bacterium]|nr:hypothetical protein [Planctomycetia bacterium]
MPHAVAAAESKLDPRQTILVDLIDDYGPAALKQILVGLLRFQMQGLPIQKIEWNLDEPNAVANAQATP